MAQLDALGHFATPFMTPTNDELYGICWELGSRILSIEDRILVMDERHQDMLKLIAKHLPDLAVEDRATLLSDAARMQTSLDQLHAALIVSRSAFEQQPKPKGMEA